MEDLFKTEISALLGGEISCECGKQHHTNARVRKGKFTEEIGKLAAKYAPLSSAVFVSSRGFFLERGGEVLRAVQSGGSDAVNVVLSRRFDNALENLGGLLSLPENVRLVVVCESELYDAAAYFSALKGIPLAYAALSPEAEGVLSPVVTLKIKNKPERLYADNPRFLIVDEDELAAAPKESVAAAFASLASHIVSLVDYRVRGVLTGDFCRASYNLARSAVSDSINAVYVENAALRLLENRVRMAAAEIFTDGAVSCGGENAAAELLESCGKSRLSAAERKFFASVILIDLYAAYFSAPHELLCVPDYGARAEELAAYTGYGEGEILKNMLACAPLAREEKLAPHIRQLAEETETLRGWMPKIAATYLKLGGRDIFRNFTYAELVRAVCRAPDLPGAFSVLTLMRESGALELLAAENVKISF